MAGYRPLFRYLREKAEVAGEWRHLWTANRPTPCGLCGRTIEEGERCTRGNGAGANTISVCVDCHPWQRWRRWEDLPGGHRRMVECTRSTPDQAPAWTVIA